MAQLTDKARQILIGKAFTYNWYVRKAAVGKATVDDKLIINEYNNEYIAMLDILKAMGVNITDEYENIENFEAVISKITVDGIVIFYDGQEV